MTKDNDWQQHLKHRYQYYMQLAEDYRDEIKGLIYFNVAYVISKLLKEYSDYYKEDK